MFLSPYHTVDTDDDEGDGEDLSHVDGQGGLEGFLKLLRVLYQETEGEDVRQTEAEVPARADFLGPLLMQCPHDDKQQGVGDGLVELAGMAGQHIHLLEDESPRNVGSLADNLAVHEVAQTDEAGGGAGGDGDVVEHRPEAQLRALAVEPEGEHQTRRAAVGGQSCVARHLPTAVGQEVDGQQHLHEALERRQEVVGLVEDAVAQSGTDEDAEEAVEEQRVEQLVLDFLLLVEFPYHEIGNNQTEEPAQGVPAEGVRADAECFYRRVPDDVIQ